jgi:hypothetical protein
MAVAAPAKSVMSKGAANAFGMAAAISPARVESRPLTPTTAPAAAIPRAISRPSPRVAPVTSTMRSDSEKRSTPGVLVMGRARRRRWLAW